MARRQTFVSQHPFLAVVIILAVELVLIVGLHLVMGWSLLTIAVVGVVVLVLVSLLMDRCGAAARASTRRAHVPHLPDRGQVQRARAGK